MLDVRRYASYYIRGQNRSLTQLCGHIVLIVHTSYCFSSYFYHDYLILSVYVHVYHLLFTIKWVGYKKTMLPKGKREMLTANGKRSKSETVILLNADREM